MTALDYILKKFNITFDQNTKMPIELPNAGRDNLAKWLAELDFKIGVEVGVAEGIYSETLCRENPQMKIYGIDPFKPYRGYHDYTKKETFKNLYDQATKRLAQRPNYEFVKEFSMEAVKKFGDDTFDFVYIDANHQNPYITQDITEWTKKVRKGGIVSGHDYIRGIKEGKPGGFDVKEAVNEYVAGHQIRPLFVIGLSAKIPGMTRDPSRSWMFIKP